MGLNPYPLCFLLPTSHGTRPGGLCVGHNEPSGCLAEEPMRAGVRDATDITTDLGQGVGLVLLRMAQPGGRMHPVGPG